VRHPGAETGVVIADDHRLLLRAALVDGDAARDAWREWRALVPFDAIDGASNRLVPLFARRIDDLAPDDPLRRLIVGIYRHAWGRNQLLIRAARPVFDALHERSVPVIALKGAALFGYYGGDWGARPMYDVDVAVPHDRFDAAAAILAAGGWVPQLGATPAWVRSRGLRRRNGWGYDAPSDARLDLHWHVLNGSLGPRADDDFWAASVPLELAGLAARSLHPADLLLHVVDHGTRDGDSADVQWVADATMILRAAGADVLADRLRDQARRHSLLGRVRDCLGTVAELLDESVAAEVRDRLDRARPRRIETAITSSRPSRFGRAPSRQLAYFGGGRTSSVAAARNALSARLDTDLGGPTWFVALYAAMGRPALVAALGRRAFGSFVRTPAPPGTVALGTDLDLLDPVVADRHAGPGWFRVTEDGLRALSREARLVLPLPEPVREPMILTVEANGALGRSSRIEVAVNERVVGVLSAEASESRIATFEVPAAIANRFTPMEVSFRGPRGRGARRLRRSSIALGVRTVRLD
jgi:hypothetical protein